MKTISKTRVKSTTQKNILDDSLKSYPNPLFPQKVANAKAILQKAGLPKELK